MADQKKPSFNVAITGYLATEPELSCAASGKCICKFSLAHGREGKDTVWFNCVAFGTLAESIAQEYGKRDLILITRCTPEVNAYRGKKYTNWLVWEVGSEQQEQPREEMPAPAGPDDEIPF